MKVVNSDSRLLLHFSLQLEDGTEVESNFAEEPMEFQIGDGSLTPGMEDALINKEVDDSIEVTLSPEMAFGIPDESNIHSIPVTDFPEDMPPVENQVIAFDGPDDSEILGTIIKVNPSEVEVDFSHPLAGRIIIFKAHIKDIVE